MNDHDEAQLFRDDEDDEEPNPIDDPELFDEYDRAYHGFESGVNHPLHGER